MKLFEIASLIGAEGTFPGIEINDIAKIETAGRSEITFLHNPKYFHLIDTTKAGAVIVPADFVTESDIPLLRVENPYQAFLKVLIAFHPVIPVAEKGINRLADISGSSSVG
jgi:UDP-3-O-[3-hydroxymyristoyl] glucosamine N-acyltransferase